MFTFPISGSNDVERFLLSCCLEVVVLAEYLGVLQLQLTLDVLGFSRQTVLD